VEVVGRVDPRALLEVLSMLTEPSRPTALGTCTWKTNGKADGLVRATMRLYSLRVQPTAAIGLDTETGE
jgi:hypothetical protein